MTLAFGKQKLGDVFQRKYMIIHIPVTHFLQFVTGQSLIVWMLSIKAGGNIVQTKTKAVKTMIKKCISSVIVVKPAYQRVNSFDTSELSNFFDKIYTFRKDM